MFEPGNGSTSRMSGLLKWWGIDESGNTAALSMMTEQVQHLISSLQGIYADAYHRQLDLMAQANKNFSSGLSGLMSCRTPDEAVAAEMALLKSMAEDISAQCRSYVELTHKLTGCIEDIARQASLLPADAQKPDARETVQQSDGRNIKLVGAA